MNKIIRTRWSRSGIIMLGLLLSLSVQAQSLDNMGTDFIFTFNPNISTPNIELHLTTDVATDVTVHYPVNSPTFDVTVGLTPGDVTIVTLPNTASQSWNPNNIQNNAVRAFTDSGTEFVTYLINRATATSDAALGLPVDTFNTEYIVSTWDAQFFGAQFNVFAAFDNTTVTITPTNALVGRAAGVPFSITLNRGEGYYGRSQSTNNIASNLTGTTVSANRPIGLINGNGCTQVPSGTTACDHIFEVAQPVQTWGQNILVSNLPNRGTTFYRIVASEDATTVSQDGVSIGTINRGQFIERSSGDDHSFSADKPIYITQYMPGQNFPGSVSGDPAMGNMIPFEQYLEDYTFSTVGGNQFPQNFLSIIVPDSQIGIADLDGSIIAAAEFSAIPNSVFSVARLPLADGVHTTSSTLGHGITVEGYDGFDSYIYPGGARFEFINPAGDANAPICTAQTNAGPPPFATGSAEDSRPSEDTNGNGQLDGGEDLNGNGQIDTDTGIFFVALEAGSTNLTLTVDPFTPGDPVATYEVDLINQANSGTGAVIATDGAGNTCRQPIDLSVGVQASCDTDNDGDVDINDLMNIRAAVRTSNPLFDIDGDGIVSYNDMRQCVLQCTNARCAPGGAL